MTREGKSWTAPSVHTSDLRRWLQGLAAASASCWPLTNVRREKRAQSWGPLPYGRVLGENLAVLWWNSRNTSPASPLPSQTTTQHPCSATAADAGQRRGRARRGRAPGPGAGHAARHCPVCGRRATSRKAARAHGPPHTRLVPSQVSHSPLDASACAQPAPLPSNSSELTDTVRHSETRSPLLWLSSERARTEPS